jgi:peptidoglycan/LPS O-acetylase OafA/YrhL
MEKNYYYSIDFLKFFCAIAVILIHVSAQIAGNDLATFWNYYIYRYFLDIGIPFFFIASGFFLVEKFN